MPTDILPDSGEKNIVAFVIPTRKQRMNRVRAVRLILGEATEQCLR